MSRFTEVPLVLAGLVLLIVTSFAWLPAIGPTPIADEAAARGVVQGTLLAHSGDSRGEPWVVFDGANQIVLDRIIADRSPRSALPPLPRLRLGGESRVVDASGSPVAAGFVPTRRGSVVFGKIEDGRVVQLNIAGAGAAVNVPVKAPGFVVDAPSPAADGALTLQWLDAGGQVVHQSQAFIAE
jgi:hypothetical protein